MSFFLAALALALLVGMVRNAAVRAPAPGRQARPKVAVPLRAHACMPVTPATDRRAA